MSERIVVGPELGLLVEIAGGRCAITVSDPDERGLRWSRLLLLARWHRLLPMLWEHVRQPSSGLEPPDIVRSALREAARESAVHNATLRFERDRIVQLLAAESIPVVLLKGSALVETVYADPGLRPMVDLDLLVPAADVARAHRAVEDLGYSVGEAHLSRDDERRLATKHDHYPLISEGGAVVVELHHHLVRDRPQLDLQGMWDRARPGPRSLPHLVQAPEDLMLHVAMHFATDRLSRRSGALGQLADVVRIAQHWDLDWDALVSRAQAGRVADRVFLALDSSRVLFGDVAPPSVVDALRPPSYRPSRGALFVQGRVLTGGPTLPIESLARGPRRVFAGVAALEYYVHPGESTPSVARLRSRRWRAIARRAVTQVPSPRRLVRDVRLSRWTLSLRR